MPKWIFMLFLNHSNIGPQQIPALRWVTAREMSVFIGFVLLPLSMHGVWPANYLGFSLFWITDFLSVRANTITQPVRSMGLAYCSGLAGALYLSSLAFRVPCQVPCQAAGLDGIAVLSSLVAFLVRDGAGWIGYNWIPGDFLFGQIMLFMKVYTFFSFHFYLILDDWLRRERFVYIALALIGYFSWLTRDPRGWFTGTTFVMSSPDSSLWRCSNAILGAPSLCILSGYEQRTSYESLHIIRLWAAYILRVSAYYPVYCVGIGFY